MQEQQQVEPHEEDDCEDCQKERAENNQLIQLYERMNKIKEKVVKIKPGLNNHGDDNRTNRNRLVEMAQKLRQAPVLQLSNVDQKEMGYELACALLQRQIKMKRENEILNRRIKEMQQENLQQRQSRKRETIRSREQQIISNSSLYSTPQSNHKSLRKSVPNDTIDNLMNTKKEKGFWGFSIQNRHSHAPSQKQRSRYSHESMMENISTNTNGSFSSFERTGRSSEVKNADPQISQAAKYDKKHLWLYQFAEEEGNLFSNVSKALSPKRSSKY